MHRFTWLFAPALLLALARQSRAADNIALPPIDDNARIVTVGDSITDGGTYPTLIRLAIKDAGKPVPHIINAGVANDESTDMLARLSKTVFAYHPTLVTLSAGVNDALHKSRPPADYEKTIRQIVEHFKAQKIPMILMTTSTLGSRSKERDVGIPLLEKYAEVVRKIAKENGYPVADVFASFQKDDPKGEKYFVDDGVHPNFQGQRAMAKAVLEAMGLGDIAVPVALDLPLLPGVISSWQVRGVDADKPVEERDVRTIKPDANWKTITLPLPDKYPPEDWHEQTRQEGFVVALDKMLGLFKKYEAYTTIDSPTAHHAYVNNGGEVQSIWVNGKRIYLNDHWTGYHYGKERIPVELHKGHNAILIEVGHDFILGITDDNQW